MALSQGRDYLAIPGPSVIPDRVLRAMHRAAPNIYEGALLDLTAEALVDLKHVARTDAHVAIYIANGHGIWEAALCNTLSRGDHILVLATGRFGHGWAEMAAGLHVQTDVLDFGDNNPIDPSRLEDALRADRAGRIKAVALCHVDTATSVRNDIATVRAAIDAAGHPALLMVDCIASLGCDPFEMDTWGVDVMLAASQKGLMTPPGMGFVWFNNKADSQRETADLASRYWDWRPRATPEIYYQHFCGTAPTHHLYGLREALLMIREEGMASVWARHDALAQAVWAAVDVWGQKGTMRLNVPDPKSRARSVTAIGLDSPDASRLRKWCEQEAGLTLGIGLGREPADGWFRIGHMGHVNASMMLGCLGTIEAGLSALGIPHTTGGVTAAAQRIAEMV